MANLIYVTEKLSMVIYHLVVNPEDVRGRLRYGLKYLMVLSPSMFPEEMQDDFERIIEELTKNNKPNDINRTLRTMRNKKGSEIAQKIYSLYDKILYYKK